MREFMRLTKALADETRVRMLLALRSGPLCVCQITELFGLAPSTVSKHLSILHQARLVGFRKEGRWIYYERCGADASESAREAVGWVDRTLHRTPRVLGDARRLKRVLKQNPTELCKRQCHR